MFNRPTRAKSLIFVAKLLDAEGFSDFTAAQVRRWWKKNRMKTSQAFRINRVKKAFQDMVKEKLNERDRLVLGRFIAMQQKMSFDAGLTAGFMATLYDPDGDAAACLRMMESQPPYSGGIVGEPR